MNISVIGLDIAKQVFHLIALDNNGKQVIRKKLTRKNLLPFFANLTPCKVSMEACSSSHHWARELTKLGHSIKLLPAQHVKAYLRGNKNDYNDALAIAEASRFAQIRPVSVKTIEQQSIQALHRLRRSAVKDRTALSNQTRGLLSEFGISIHQGISHLRQALPRLLEDAENDLHYLFRDALALKQVQLSQLDELIDSLTASIQIHASKNPHTQLLRTIPGFGPINSSAYVSVIGDGKAFRNGRGVSAALGVIPRQHSSGDKPVLLGISKRGDKYLRSLLVHGARSVVQQASGKEDHLSLWINRIVERRGKNKAIVALANKMARIGWAVITTNKPYRDNYAH